jgi:TrmH family RNA methyltransferase
VTRPVITSPSNQRIKDLVRLKDRKGDQAETHFVVEGAREIDRALKSGFKLTEIFYCHDVANDKSLGIVHSTLDSLKQQITSTVFERIATRGSSDGLIAVFQTITYCMPPIESLKKSPNKIIIATEDVEKPGNLGAILRTADASGMPVVVALDKTVDIWNPNVIRASLGGIFSVPVVCMTSSDFFEWCQTHKYRTVASMLSSDSQSLFDTKLTGHAAVILGNEASGLSEFWQKKADEKVCIPMLGLCDSLNVSVAGALFMYEALRQTRTNI